MQMEFGSSVAIGKVGDDAFRRSENHKADTVIAYLAKTM